MRTTRLSAITAGAITLSGLLAPAAKATILTFDLTPPGTDYTQIPQAYGDRVTSTSDAVGTYGVGAEGFTPNVLASYQTVNAAGATIFGYVDLWTSSYGDLYNVVFPAQNGAYAEITLTPDPGYEVSLISFDAGGWPNVNRNEQLKVLAGGSVALDYGNVVFPGSGHSTYSPNLTSSSPITIWFGSDWDGGIDNIVFAQSRIQTGVPDAGAACGLLGLGLAALGLARRKLS